MKICILALVLSIGIYFNFIELSSQSTYNHNLLDRGQKGLIESWHIQYKISDGTMLTINRTSNPHGTRGLMIRDTTETLVCAFEGDYDIVRAMFIGTQRVKVNASHHSELTDTEVGLYGLDFDHELH